MSDYLSSWKTVRTGSHPTPSPFCAWGNRSLQYTAETAVRRVGRQWSHKNRANKNNNNTALASTTNRQQKAFFLFTNRNSITSITMPPRTAPKLLAQRVVVDNTCVDEVFRALPTADSEFCQHVHTVNLSSQSSSFPALLVTSNTCVPYPSSHGSC